MDLTGQRFGRLKVLRLYSKSSSADKSYWLCKCDCKMVCAVREHNLRYGHTKSCGCLRSEMARARMKQIHANHKQRRTNDDALPTDLP